MPLSQKEELFCREFLLDLNASAAARRAGYAERYVNRIAYRLMSKVDIQERIAELKRERAERVQVEADDVLRELSLIAFSDIGDPGGGILDFSGDEPVFRPARQVS